MIGEDLPDSPYVAIAVIDVVPAMRARFLAAMEETMRHSAREEGIISFRLLVDRDDPCRFTAVDLFRDRAAYEAHLVAPHSRSLVEKLEGCLRGRPQSTFHREVTTDEAMRDE